jgi:hypothetical protein
MDSSPACFVDVAADVTDATADVTDANASTNINTATPASDDAVADLTDTEQKQDGLESGLLCRLHRRRHRHCVQLRLADTSP